MSGETWRVTIAQYEGGRAFGPASTRLADKVLAEGVSRFAADALLRKHPGASAMPEPKECPGCSSTRTCQQDCPVDYAREVAAEQRELARTRVTTAAYVRSHGSEPRGRGGWMFRLATRPTAYDDELYGEEFCPGGMTYTDARRAALAHFGRGKIVAVLS